MSTWDDLLRPLRGAITTHRTGPHVRAASTIRDPLDGDEEQKIVAWCSVCDASFRRTCTSGRVLDHIQRFERVHAHNGSDAPPEAGELDEPLGPTEYEKSILFGALARAVLLAVSGFVDIAHEEGPEVPADILTPQRLRDLVALIVHDFAPVTQIAAERLHWLLANALSLDLPQGGRCVPIHEFLEGKVP